MSEYSELKTIWSRDKKMRGIPTGGTRRCQLESCGATQTRTKWPDGKVTWLCAEGLTFLSNRIARIGFKQEWRKQ